MADTPQTTALITLAQEYRGDVVRQINRKTTLIKALSIKDGAGQNVAWVPESDGQVAENYTEGADTVNFGSDAQASATLPWGLYRSPFRVTSLAMDTAATSGTPEGNLQLWARNMMNSASKLADLIETAAFSGAGGAEEIAGLDVAIGDDTNTYATIDRSAAAYWRPTVVDALGAAPTMALIRSDIGQIFDASGENPDLAVCSTATFNSVANLFDPNRRWTTVNTARGEIELNAGYAGIDVDGCMFIKASKATSNRIYYLNSNHVHFQVLPCAKVPNEVAEAEVADDGFGPVPLQMIFEPLAKLGNSSRAQGRSTVQLVVERPNACGVRLNMLE